MDDGPRRYVECKNKKLEANDILIMCARVIGLQAQP